jgi:hypothetical protein
MKPGYAFVLLWLGDIQRRTYRIRLSSIALAIHTQNQNIIDWYITEPKDFPLLDRYNTVQLSSQVCKYNIL